MKEELCEKRPSVLQVSAKQWALTLSPHIALRPQVLTIKALSRTNFQAEDSRMVRQNRVSGSQVIGFGI